METHEKIVKPIQEEKENANMSSPEDTHEANTSFGQGEIIFAKLIKMDNMTTFVSTKKIKTIGSQ